jgi:DNA-binding XRE family transcriptional regulator
MVIRRGVLKISEKTYTLEAARVNVKMTQKQAGKAIGKSDITISKWENGKSVPDMDSAQALARLYGLLLTDIAWPRKSA